MTKVNMSLNNFAWETIFDELHILDDITSNGIYSIAAKDIKKIGNREPRLMTYFDHSNNLPQIFREHGLSILPNARGNYLIGHFKTHHVLETETIIAPIKMKLPLNVSSINQNEITSESVALNMAHATGMIDYVLGSIKLRESFLTVSGRLSSNELSFFIDSSEMKESSYAINVKNSQMEIDGSYENNRNFAIIEAKNKAPKDFLIRQLYYPYLYFSNKKINKKIVPIFFTYTGGVFSFHIYEFLDVSNYSSITKIKQLNFMIEDNLKIEYKDIVALISQNGARIWERKDIPFPQADDFLRVLDLLNYVSDEPRTKSDIALYYGFDERQSDYYFNALRFLGYAEKIKQGSPVSITIAGKNALKNKESRDGKMAIIKNILSDTIFKEAMKKTIESQQLISRNDVAYLLASNMNDISKETMNRRTSSVRGWINWIVNQIAD